MVVQRNILWLPLHIGQMCAFCGGCIYISDMPMMFRSFLEMVAGKTNVTGGYVRPVTGRANTSCFDETYDANDFVVHADVTYVSSLLCQSAALDVLG